MINVEISLPFQELYSIVLFCIIGKHHTVKRRASGSYLVEVYIIVDYQIYDL